MLSSFIKAHPIKNDGVTPRRGRTRAFQPVPANDRSHRLLQEIYHDIVISSILKYSLIIPNKCGLCEWFSIFYEAVNHAVSHEIRGDVDGYNFIITSNHVVSVDFEERAYGTREHDIGRLMAFIYSYSISGRFVQERFAQYFHDEAIKRLHLSPNEIRKQFGLELDAIRERRRQANI